MNPIFILGGLAVLGLMVIIHEWGHYVAARAFGVRVVTFSVGFGPRLFGRKRGPTDFCVRAFPLGGYVKMAGDNYFEEREGKPDEFFSKPRWQRSIIAFAGPFVNIVFAVLLLATVYMFYFEIPEFLNDPPAVAAVRPDSPAEKAGIREGDVILSVDGTEISDWDDLISRVLLTAGETLKVRAQHGAEIVDYDLIPAKRGADGDVYVGWEPATRVTLARIGSGGPADRAGLKLGDEIVRFDDIPVAPQGVWRFTELIKGTGGEPFTLTVLRGEETLEVELQAELSDLDGVPTHMIQIAPAPITEIIQLSPGDAFRESLLANQRFLQLMWRLVRRLFTGRSNISIMQGPIGIVAMAGQVFSIGPAAVFGFMALISINLGVLNLLPIPILDGGHIATFAIEGVLRRDLSLRVKERFIQVGFVALMLLFVVVMYNDIMRYFVR